MSSEPRRRCPQCCLCDHIGLPCRRLLTTLDSNGRSCRAADSLALISIRETFQESLTRRFSRKLTSLEHKTHCVPERARTGQCHACSPQNQNIRLDETSNVVEVTAGGVGGLDFLEQEVNPVTTMWDGLAGRAVFPERWKDEFYPGRFFQGSKIL